MKDVLYQSMDFYQPVFLKEVALVFAGKSSDEIHQSILFEFQCDLKAIQTIVLAHIAKFSVNKSEEEVLIDIGAVFQIISVESKEDYSLIKLKATDKGNQISKTYQNLSTIDYNQIYYLLLVNVIFIKKNMMKILIILIRLMNIRETYYLYDHFESACNLNLLAKIYTIKGDYKRALHYFSHATSIYERTLPVNHRNQSISFKTPADIAFSLDIQANIYCHLEDDRDKALELLQQSLDTKRTYLTENNLEIAIILTVIGNDLQENERYDEALINHL
ncbi:hypothetical protein I4U23_011351 [Adineta vaga]|nr:hypothetical protein I4U23_011351 [Adineta vaga]